MIKITKKLLAGVKLLKCGDAHVTNGHWAIRSDAALADAVAPNWFGAGAGGVDAGVVERVLTPPSNETLELLEDTGWRLEDEGVMTHLYQVACHSLTVSIDARYVPIIEGGTARTTRTSGAIFVFDAAGGVVAAVMPRRRAEDARFGLAPRD